MPKWQCNNVAFIFSNIKQTLFYFLVEYRGAFHSIVE